MLASRDMLSQEAYERASLPETSVHVITLRDQSHGLAVRNRTFFRAYFQNVTELTSWFGFMCQSVFLLERLAGCGVMWFILER